MGCGGSEEKQEKEVVTTEDAEPTAADMEKAKLLYVKLKIDFTTNPDLTDLNALKYVLGDMDGGATKAWSALPGLRHKYFCWHEETSTCSGVYVFYDEKSLNDYMEGELFKAQGTYPHVTEVEAEVKDVMPGTEMSIEKSAWAHSPVTRDDITAGKMLIVDLTMDYESGVEGLPTKKEELYGFIASGYPAEFGKLEGLRGKYFCYDDKNDHCYGFYTFVDQASLDKYQASDLFTKQGEPPHIKEISFTVHDILPGTEFAMDLGAWGK
jgi:hypothetical protein